MSTFSLDAALKVYTQVAQDLLKRVVRPHKRYARANKEQQPNIVLIGAGGCSLATNFGFCD